MQVPEYIVTMRLELFSTGDNATIARMASKGKTKPDGKPLFNSQNVVDAFRRYTADKRLLLAIHKYYTNKKEEMKEVLTEK